jgi:hypothetical protein
MEGRHVNPQNTKQYHMGVRLGVVTVYIPVPVTTLNPQHGIMCIIHQQHSVPNRVVWSNSRCCSSSEFSGRALAATSPPNCHGLSAKLASSIAEIRAFSCTHTNKVKVKYKFTHKVIYMGHTYTVTHTRSCIHGLAYKVTHSRSHIQGHTYKVIYMGHTYTVTHARSRIQGHAYKVMHTRSRIQGHAYKVTHTRSYTQGHSLKVLHTRSHTHGHSLKVSHTRSCIQGHAYKVTHTRSHTQGHIHKVTHTRSHTQGHAYKIFNVG